MKIQFIGATGTVTGSKYLISKGSARILVDCGLFQGLKQLRLRNWVKLPFKASEINHVILTHAHIDHTGYLPLLVKNGFRGKVYCSHGTAELCKILLPDSGYLQEEDAHFANRHGFSKHHPAKPLYTREDAYNSLPYLHPIDFNKEVDLEGHLSFSLISAGHILGASFVKIRDGKVTTLFTGDMGRPHDIIMNPPTIVEEVDYLVMESTYGDRLHGQENAKKELAEIINKTSYRGGVTIIPAFAVGRAQAILYLLHLLKKEKKIPEIPIYLDSPMATDVTELYCRLDKEHRLSHEECKAMCQTAEFVNTPEESKSLDQEPFPKIIVCASGMATGGRVLHHLKAFLSDFKNTILFTGFQAAGTRGQALVAGANSVKIHGEYFPVRAKIIQLDSLSAHADYEEILGWLRHFKHPPIETFLIHGEPIAADFLRHLIEEKLKWKCTIPEYLQIVSLNK